MTQQPFSVLSSEGAPPGIILVGLLRVHCAQVGLSARMCAQVWADEPTCTPGSVAVCRYRHDGGDHPSWTTVAGGLTRPTRRLGRAALGRLLCGLAPDGVCLAAAVTCGAGGLLPHPFTLASGMPEAVCSLWHFPAGHPGWPLATVLLCGARTFLDPLTSQRYRGRPVGSSAPTSISAAR